MPQTFTVSEAAKKLGVTPGRVRHFISEGRLPAREVGPIYLIEASDLSSFQRNKRPNGRHLIRKK